MNDIESVLSRLGYDLKSESVQYWRAKPLYRESGNGTSLRISKKHGGFADFSANLKGSLVDLIKLTLGLKSIKEANKWLDDNEIEIQQIDQKPKPVVTKRFQESESNTLLPHFTFYKGRGIDISTLKEFECGMQMSGKQNNRFVFVVRNEEGEIIGLAGRDLLNRDHKWKLLGDKRTWIYPLSSLSYIEGSKELILVESVGDMLALANAGIKNVLVLFGIVASNKLINFISSLNIEKIIISTNNDFEKEQNSGEVGAQFIKSKLSKFVNEEKITINLPPKNDWGCMTKEEIKQCHQR